MFFFMGFVIFLFTYILLQVYIVSGYTTRLTSSEDYEHNTVVENVHLIPSMGIGYGIQDTKSTACRI